MQVVFFVSPILFRLEDLDEDVRGILQWNPIGSILAVARDPLLGKIPSSHDYLMAGGLVLVGFAITLPFFGYFRRRIVYWV